ncbi:MAG: hypothetical protein LLG20_02835 [Acidobacteriales bacterium]|nr:hypothetical protein [Terriglobales bacterium]
MAQVAYTYKWIRESVSLILTLLFLVPPIQAKPPAQTPQQMKQIVSKVGTGEKAKVKVKMKDGQTLAGHIRSSDEAGLTLVTNGQTRTIAYSETVSIEKKGMHPAAWAAIVVGVIAGVIIGITFAACGSSGC